MFHEWPNICFKQSMGPEDTSRRIERTAQAQHPVGRCSQNTEVLLPVATRVDVRHLFAGRVLSNFILPRQFEQHAAYRPQSMYQL